jgi:glycosyltransferase involved in cell wall biosynthesis
MINHYASSPAHSWSARHVSLGASLVKRGHSVKLFASSFDDCLMTRRSGSPKPIEWEPFAGVDIGWLPAPEYHGNSWGRGWNTLVFAFRVLQLPKHCHPLPDLVYASTPSLFQAMAGLILARRLGVPFVLEIRDIWPQSLIDVGMSRFHPFILVSAVIERYLYQHADAIISLMPDAAPHLVAHGAAQDRIHWIPNGVNFDVVPPLVPPAKKDVLEVLYAGGFGGGNNPRVILDAAAVLRQRGGPALRFRIIGSGPQEAEMIAKRAALKLDNVSIEPPTSRIKVYPRLSQADILLAPYSKLGVHRFGVSLNKLFDYMAVARPVVFANHASNHPVRDAGCGLECPAEDPIAIADAILKLAGTSVEERWKMGLRGRHYVEQNHDFARLAVKLEAILAGASRESLLTVKAPQSLKS